MAAAPCDRGATKLPGQKTRRPEGYRGKGRLASLLVGQRSMKDILPPRASPSGLFPDNSFSHHFQSGSKPEPCNGVPGGTGHRPVLSGDPPADRVARRRARKDEKAELAGR